jgi:trimeric autotransporter adhesin
MKRNTQQIAGAVISPWQRVAFVMLLLISVFAALNVNRAYAAPPPAGTSIGNQASAAYSDALGNAQPPVTSNTVVTTVAQVASFTLTADQTKPGAPGTQIYFPHTLNNTGNGNDTFTLAVANLAGGTFDFSSVAIYIDANGDGIPDNATPITTSGAVAAGGVFRFVAVGIVPGGALNGQTDQLRVTAAGDAGVAAAAIPSYIAAAAASNTDTVTVTGNAVINITKSMSALSGADGSGPYTITLTYTNTGNATATTVNIGDVIPAGMTYVANSGRWSVTGATVLTDANAADAQGTVPNTVIYDFGVTTAGRMTAVVNQVLPGGNGTVTFNVNIAAGTAPGVINNTATYAYNDSTANVGPFNTNTVGFTVNQRAAVVLDDIGSVANGIAGSLVADSDATADVVGVATVPQGSTVQFDNVVHNNGNGADSFDMTLSGSTFPAGTSFQFYRADGVTPLVDTNGNATPDTGSVATGGTYHVIVKALLPIGASGNNGGAGFVVTKTATSRFDATKTDTVTDRLGAISANSVDMTNNTWRTDVAPAGGTAASGNAATTGFGTGTASAVTTQSTNPGTITTFRLYLNNTSTVDDNYDLSVTSALPAGWTVAFKADGGAGNCSTTGATITNSGIINASNSRLICAEVSVASTGTGAVAGTTNITFRAQSSASGAFDTKVDAVTVNTIHNVVLTPNNTGQAFPGNFVVYTHSISNNGNVTETISFPAGTFLTDSAATWSSVLYRDNGTTPGALDAADTSVSSATTFTLAPGASATLFAKVTAPLTATAGQTDTTTITAAYNSGAATTSATDITTVISGVLNLAKDQALDAACDGTPDTAYGNGTITARPGQCVRYRITATNSGTANVTSVVLSDSTPANTLYNTGGTCFPAGAPGSFGAATTVGTVATTPAGAAANCTASVTVSATVGSLTPSQSAVLTFGVQVNQ